MTQEQYKAKLIQLIQINKNNVFIDDEDRKEFMMSRFGVSSTKEMSIDELNRLLDFCLKKVSDVPYSPITSAQYKKIMELWKAKARNKEFYALQSFIRKISGKPIEILHDLTKSEATKVIVALERMK
jgi:phage gp16-like protein